MSLVPNQSFAAVGVPMFVSTTTSIPEGPTGAQGPQGPEGPIGSPGAPGQPGVTGPAGANGVAGATGPTGANGTNGATGPTGANGTNGATGPAGALTSAYGYFSFGSSSGIDITNSFGPLVTSVSPQYSQTAGGITWGAGSIARAVIPTAGVYLISYQFCLQGASAFPLTDLSFGLRVNGFEVLNPNAIVNTVLSTTAGNSSLPYGASIIVTATGANTTIVPTIRSASATYRVFIFSGSYLSIIRIA